MSRMFDPPHPGFTLRDDVLPALGLGVSQAAAQLGISRVALSRVLNGHAAITPEFALRLESWLGMDRGGDAAVWLAQQAEYDLWHAEQAMQNKPKPAQGLPEVMEVMHPEAITKTVEWIATSHHKTAEVIFAAAQSSAAVVKFGGSAPQGQTAILATNEGN